MRLISWVLRPALPSGKAICNTRTLALALKMASASAL